MTVEQFFKHYAALSMGGDDRALAAVYAPRVFVGGPTIHAGCVRAISAKRHSAFTSRIWSSV